jgi:hypothetical protein
MIPKKLKEEMKAVFSQEELTQLAPDGFDRLFEKVLRRIQAGENVEISHDDFVQNIGIPVRATFGPGYIFIPHFGRIPCPDSPDNGETVNGWIRVEEGKQYFVPEEDGDQPTGREVRNEL